MPRWILGLGGSDHDFSAALMCDGDIRVAIEQERLSRRKYGKTLWFESPVQKAINYCLAAEDISMGEVSAIVSGDTLPARVRVDLRSHDLHLYPHHLCHAASAYMMLPRGAKAGVLVYDGFGSVCGSAEDELHCKRETFSFFVFHPKGYECLGRNLGTASVEGERLPRGSFKFHGAAVRTRHRSAWIRSHGRWQDDGPFIVRQSAACGPSEELHPVWRRAMGVLSMSAA